MRTWQVKADDGQSWMVDAPDDATEAEVNGFAAENADSWTNGGHYAMTAAVTEPAAPAAPESPNAARTVNEKADAYVRQLAAEMKKIDDERMKLAYGHFRSPAVLAGGDGQEVAPVGTQLAELTKKYDELKAKRDALEIGTTGATVGGIGGSLGGGAIGVGLGALTGPFAPVAMPIGGLIGSILGGAGGAAAGTHLWDIPEARGARDINEAEAAQLIKDRAIESLVWDGAFVLVLGPGGKLIGKMLTGGKLIGKMLNGARIGPAMKAVARETLKWDDVVKIKQSQMSNAVAKRAKELPAGVATQASDALKIAPAITPEAANQRLIADVAARSGGRVPTTGEVRGVVGGGEQFVRRQSPTPFFENDKILSETAEKVRREALDVLDQAGAVTGPELGASVRTVVQSADRSLKRATGPVFERAAQQNVVIDMRDTLQEIERVLFRDTEAAGSLLKGDRAYMEGVKKALKEEPYMSPQGVQDFISGQKSTLRGMDTGGAKPGEFMQKALGKLVETADRAFITTLRGVNDPTLVRDLLSTRELYRATMDDLYSDTWAKMANKTPEDVGKVFITPGTVTEIRELRKALDRAVSVAPQKARYKGSIVPENLRELSQRSVIQERARIDAGLVKGFIEKNTLSLTDLESKMRDPDFLLTLKELLTGKGVADPVLGKKVLDELDRTMGVVRLIRPEMAPQPGRILPSGVGGMGAGTVVGGVTGQGISPITVGTLLGALSGARFIAKATATAMTNGNLGTFRLIQRATALAHITGRNAAAAEALHGVLRELDEWDRTTPEKQVQ